MFLINKQIGMVKDPPKDLFDPKIQPEQCSEKICSFGGKCLFDQYVKKYICICDEGRAGFNCTYKNETELQLMRNYTFALSQIY